MTLLLFEDLLICSPTITKPILKIADVNSQESHRIPWPAFVTAFRDSQIFGRWGFLWLNKLLNILNKSEIAAPELFAIYIQNDASQESKWKCIWMFKDWVMHNRKILTDVVTSKDMKVI